MLQRGEVLPDIDIEAEIELIESTKLSDLDIGAAGGVVAEEEEVEAADAEEESPIRAEVIKRLKKLAENDEDEDS